MATLEKTRAVEDLVAEKIKKVQDLYADAPEVGRKILTAGVPQLGQNIG